MPRFRGREGYWAWVLHRASGLGVLLFLVLHVVDTSLVSFAPALYDHAVAIFYRHPLAKLGEIVLGAALLYHATNGVRIILIDFWDGAVRVQRQLWYAAWAVFLVLFVPTAAIMAARI